MLSSDAPPPHPRLDAKEFQHKCSCQLGSPSRQTVHLMDKGEKRQIRKKAQMAVWIPLRGGPVLLWPGLLWPFRALSLSLTSPS